MRYLLLIVTLIGCTPVAPWKSQMQVCHEPNQDGLMVVRMYQLAVMCGDHVPWHAKINKQGLEFSCLAPFPVAPYVPVPPGKIPGSKNLVADAGTVPKLAVPSVKDGEQTDALAGSIDGPRDSGDIAAP
jgi:hypothetical protein